LRVNVNLLGITSFLRSLGPLAPHVEGELEHVICAGLWEGSIFLTCGKRGGGALHKEIFLQWLLERRMNKASEIKSRTSKQVKTNHSYGEAKISFWYVQQVLKVYTNPIDQKY